MARVFCAFSIYTIALQEKLDEAERSNRGGHFLERKAWTTGYRLWNEAMNAGSVMPALFGDASNCSRLLSWGILTKITIEGETTGYSVSAMRRIKGRTPQELQLKSTGKTIAPNFIRPYAIVTTPSFIARQLSAELVREYGLGR